MVSIFFPNHKLYSYLHLMNKFSNYRKKTSSQYHSQKKVLHGWSKALYQKTPLTRQKEKLLFLKNRYIQK